MSVLTIATVGVTIGLAVWLAGGNGNGAEAATPAETAPAETEAPADTETEAAETETEAAETETAEAETETVEVETETAEAETEAAPATGDPAAGEQVFAEAGCGSCHTLAAAGSSGQVGPNLDESQPPLELVIDRVTNGEGAMPPFSGTLSEQQIQDVAAYVVQSTSG